MSQRKKANILLVDDQPAKLLSLETILSDLDENVIKTSSADEALKLLLSLDIAVVLVDVCMPNMDGFELAELIRDHPRFRRTAIIFISAVHLTDADRLRGYNLGAVDYIPVPIIPEVLRAKVAVFAELYRKTDQLQRLNQELEQRVADRTADVEASSLLLRDSERLYRQLVNGLPAALYTCDAQGRITFYNQAAADLWGREPVLGTDAWCGSWRIYRPDGSPLPLDECPMAVTLREGRPVRGEEVIIERPDGTQRSVMPYPDPIFDASGKLVGALNMLMDITDAKRAERAQALLAEIVASSDDAIISKTLEGIITSWNAGAERIFGYTSDEIVGRSITTLIPPEYMDEEREILARLRRGERAEHFETVRVTKDGRRVDVSLTISPVHDAQGRVIGASKVARDVTERKKAEAVLARDRETLERLVAERTIELERTAERLRLADRMATIGTLSAGLGHDMGNLLLPIRMRLDAIEALELPAAARENIAAIRKASEYLQRLAASLRLLALDPESEVVADAATDLPEWWNEAEGMMHNGIPRNVALSAEIPGGLPAVQIGKAGLTQIVFNLVQNAGDALRGQSNGRVAISAAAAASGNAIRLSVTDNGPGMNEEARRRCMEPFYTTKTRGLSTGLGLTLVSGLVKRAHGSIQIETELQKGTTFTIELPIAPRTSKSNGQGNRQRNIAVVTLKDMRMLAHVRAVLVSMEFDVRPSELAEADVWVTEADENGGLEAARRFVASGPVRCALVLGGRNGDANHHDRVVYLEPPIKPSTLRSRIQLALTANRRTPEKSVEHQ